MLNDTLATALSNIQNATNASKKVCIARPASKMIMQVLQIMKDNHYVGDFKLIEDGCGNMIEINLIGAVNKCKAIKPRLSFTNNDYEKFEKRFLIAHGMGFILVTTSQGVMTLEQAQEKLIGGKLLAFVY
ncbi:MAG: 30S ribosomal protein S8 [archaeon]